MQKELNKSGLLAQSSISAKLKLAFSGGKEVLLFLIKIISTIFGFIWLQLFSISLFTKLNINKESLSHQMIAESQEIENESTLIGFQRDPNEIDNRWSKIKNARFSCLKYHIDSKWDDKATENQTEKTQKGNSLKEDFQKTLTQINGKKIISLY